MAPAGYKKGALIVPWEAFKNMPPGVALLAALAIIGGGGGSIGLSGFNRMVAKLDAIEDHQHEAIRKMDGFEWRVSANSGRLSGNASKNREQDTAIEKNKDDITRLNLSRMPYDGSRVSP